MFFSFRSRDRLAQIEQNILRLIRDEHHSTARTQSELQELSYQQSTHFFLALANIISNTSIPTSIRLVACNIFARFVHHIVEKEKGQTVMLWEIVQNDKKEIIKECLLRSLLEENQSLVRKASTCIARIVLYSIPNLNYLNLLQLVRQNLHNDRQIYVINSAILLNELCIEFNRSNQPIPEPANSLIVQILLKLLERDSVQSNFSLDSLREIYLKIKQNVEIADRFDYLIERLLVLIERESTRINTYKLLFRIIQQSYCPIQNYMYIMSQLTAKHISKRNQQSIFAIRFWQATAQTYLLLKNDKLQAQKNNLSKVQNYVIVSQFTLLPQLFSYFQIQYNENGEVNWIREEVYKLLWLIAECGNEHTFNSFLHTATGYLVDIQDDRKLEELLKCIQKFSPNQKIFNSAQWWICCLFKKIHNCTQKQQIYILSIFYCIADTIPEAFLASSVAEELISSLLMLAQCQNQEKRIHSLAILQKIRSKLKNGELAHLIDSPVFVRQIFNIFKINTEKQHLQRDQIYPLTLLIQNTIQKIYQPQLFDQFLHFLIQRYITLNQQKKYNLNYSIINIAITCLFRLRYHSQVNSNNSKTIFDMINIHFTTFGVQAEGLSLIEATVACYPQSFTAYLDKYWSILQKIVEQGKFETKVFEVALQNIGTICRSCCYENIELKDKISYIIKVLSGFLERKIHIESKIEIIRCLSDFGTIYKQIEEKMANMIFSIISRQFTLFQSYKNDKKCFILYEEVLKIYHSWMFNLKNNNFIFKQQLHQIYEFIFKSTNKLYSPPQAYLMSVILLLFDLQILLGKSTKQGKQLINLLLSPQINNIIFQISKETNQSVETLLEFVNARRNTF